MLLSRSLRRFFLFTLLVCVFFPAAFALPSTDLRFDINGDDQYTLYFENMGFTNYDTVYLNAENGYLKYGSDSMDFVFIEGVIDIAGPLAAQQFNIGALDSFVINSQVIGPNGVPIVLSRILRYDAIDLAMNTITFSDPSLGSTIQFTYFPSSLPGVLGEFDLVVSGTSHQAYIANIDAPFGHPLAIDMNGDQTIDRSEVTITTLSGEVLDLGDGTESDGGVFTVFNATEGNWSNLGDTIPLGLVGASLTTAQNLYFPNRPAQQEILQIVFQELPANQLTVDSVQSPGNFFITAPGPTATTSYGQEVELSGSGDIRDLRITSVPELDLFPFVTYWNTDYAIEVAETSETTVNFIDKVTAQEINIPYFQTNALGYTFQGSIFNWKSNNVWFTGLFDGNTMFLGQFVITNNQWTLPATPISGGNAAILTLGGVPYALAHGVIPGFITLTGVSPGSGPLGYVPVGQMINVPLDGSDRAIVFVNDWQIFEIFFDTFNNEFVVTQYLRDDLASLPNPWGLQTISPLVYR